MTACRRESVSFEFRKSRSDRCVRYVRLELPRLPVDDSRGHASLVAPPQPISSNQYAGAHGGGLLPKQLNRKNFSLPVRSLRVVDAVRPLNAASRVRAVTPNDLAHASRSHAGCNFLLATHARLRDCAVAESQLRRNGCKRPITAAPRSKRGAVRNQAEGLIATPTRSSR
jgi:hypothetical protein